MAKIKFDRIVNITLKSSEETIVVPENEFWKGTGLFDQIARINDKKCMSFLGQGNEPYKITSITLASGIKITGGAIFTGIAFKIIEEKGANNV